MKRPAALPLAAMLAGMALIGVSAIAHPRPRLVWNASASVAAGLYRVIPGALERGDFVLVRIPKSIEKLAAMRGYLPAGVPLIKRVAAVAGNDVRAFDGAVIVKSRIVKLAGKGMNGARAHLRYIRRDGVTREGGAERGELYGAEQNRVDGKAFLERSEDDRHQFRFIVSAEDGAEYDDLKPLTRRLMARMEEDLATHLDWVAVDHYNTGHPHTHILLRGRDERGKDLIIARDYITTGMRERAAEIVSLDFGPRSDIEIEARLRREVEQERLTGIDRRLVSRLLVTAPHQAGG